MDLSENKSQVMPRPKRRLGWSVEPGFQRRYSFMVLGLVVLTGSLLIGTVALYTYQVERILLASGLTPFHESVQNVQAHSRVMLAVLALVCLIFGAFVYCAFRLLLRRVAGPVFAIKRSLRALLDGNTQAAKLRFRQGDEFEEISELVNQLVERSKGQGS